MVVTRPAKIVGKIINAGLVLPDAIIIPITVVGISWTPELANTIVIIIGKVAIPLLLSISSIALIPRGIEAPPMPRTLVESDRERYFFALSLIDFLPQRRLISGERSLDKNSLNFVFSTIPKIPSQTAYIASNSNESVNALLVAPIIDGKMLSGEAIVSIIQASKQTIIQILFIVNFIKKQSLLWPNCLYELTFVLVLLYNCKVKIRRMICQRKNLVKNI